MFNTYPHSRYLHLFQGEIDSPSKHVLVLKRETYKTLIFLYYAIAIHIYKSRKDEYLMFLSKDLNLIYNKTLMREIEYSIADKTVSQA